MLRETQPSPANGGRPQSDQDGAGEPDDQLLEDGQEEVFAREEVMLGRIEHQVGAGSGRVEGDHGGSKRDVGREDLTSDEPCRAEVPAPAAQRTGPGARETLGAPKPQQGMLEDIGQKPKGTAKVDASVTQTAAIGLASVLLGLGAIFVTRTGTATKLFGLAQHAESRPLVQALGLRDLALGGAIIAFARGNTRTPLAPLAAAFVLVPLGDAVIVAKAGGWARWSAVALHLSSGIALAALALSAGSERRTRG